MQPVQERVSEPEHRQPLHATYWQYCPLHEFDYFACCNCCLALKAELRRIDQALRQHWLHQGYSFRDRGRSSW